MQHSIIYGGLSRFKVAVAGKGGVGKTFVAGTLSRSLAKMGRRLVAIDADPAMNLAYALGIPDEEAKRIIPLSENLDMIEERTGARPGATGAVFNLTPRVQDIVEKYGVYGPNGIRLLVLGTIRLAGAGCMCPANAFLRALLRHQLTRTDEGLLIDMEAGLEHLGRGVVRGFDVLLDIVEPGSQSIKTALRILSLARELKVRETLLVGNKIRNDAEREILSNALAKEGLSLFNAIPYDHNVEQADITRVAPIDYAPSCRAVVAVQELATALIRRMRSE